MQGNGRNAGLASARFWGDLSRACSRGPTSSCGCGIRRGAGAAGCAPDVRFVSTDGSLEVVLEGEDVSAEIRTQDVANTASKVAAFPRVREALLRRQRAFRELPGLIADGRDMGTVVFPDAPVKIFLDASAEERAHRRMLQLQEKGFSVNFDRLLSEIKSATIAIAIVQSRR